MCFYTQTDTHVLAHTHMYTRTHAHTHAHTRTYTHARARMRAFIVAFVCVRVVCMCVPLLDTQHVQSRNRAGVLRFTLRTRLCACVLRFIVYAIIIYHSSALLHRCVYIFSAVCSWRTVVSGVVCHMLCALYGRACIAVIVLLINLKI